MMRLLPLLLLLGGCQWVFPLDGQPPEADANIGLTCPTDYEQVGTSRFRLVTTMADWISAEMDCVNDAPFDTHLATPDSLVKLNLMLNAAGKQEEFWVGAARDAIADPSEFRTVTGGPVPVTLWNPDQPDNTNSNEFAVHVVASRLNDRNPNIPLAYLCECDGMPLFDDFKF